MRAWKHLPLLLTVAVAAGLPACGGDDLRIEFEPDAAAGSPIELALRPTKGFASVLRAETDTVMEMESDGEEARADVKMGFEIAYEVKDVDEAGVAVITTTFKAIDMKSNLEAPGRSGTSSYDSRTGRAEPEGLKVLGKMIGVSIEMKVNPDGSITEVSGLENLMGIGGMQGEQNAKALTQAFKQMTMFFPDRPVDNGDKWDSTYEFELPAPISMKLKWKLECMLLSHDETTATVGINATMEIHGTPGDAGSVSAELTGTMGGTAKMDLGSGFTTGMELKSRFGGTMEVNGREMELTIEVKTKLTPVR